MIFKVFSNGLSTIRLSNQGLILNDSSQFISTDYLFLYIYNGKENTYYHLMIQDGQYSWENFIMFEENDLVKSLKNNPNIFQKSFDPILEEIDKYHGFLKNEDDTWVSWGPIKDTGSYSVDIKMSYRKDYFVMGAHPTQFDKKLDWNYIEQVEIDLQSLQNHDHVIAYGVWENEPQYWLKYYKRKEVKDDNGWGCQNTFLIVMALFVLYLIIWKFFLS